VNFRFTPHRIRQIKAKQDRANHAARLFLRLGHLRAPLCHVRDLAELVQGPGCFDSEAGQPRLFGFASIEQSQEWVTEKRYLDRRAFNEQLARKSQKWGG
jgi:hypothetical protein